MKKLFFLFAFAFLAFSTINAASIWNDYVSASTGTSNQYKTYSNSLYGKWVCWTEAHGAGAYAQSQVIFNNNSALTVWSHGPNYGIDSDQGNKVGRAATIRLSAMTGEHGYYHNDAHSWGQVQCHVIQ